MAKFIFLFLILTRISLADELKLLTWNTYMIPKPIRFSHQGTRTTAIAKLFQNSDYDVIFLQETFSSHFQETIEKELRTKYPWILILEKNSGLFKILGPGLMAISKYPMKDIGHIYFDDCATADCFASKGAQLVEVTLPSGKRIQIANTHMQSGVNHAAIRKVQLDQIKKLLKSMNQENVPQLLVGDLNIDSARGDEFPGSLTMLEMHPVRRDVFIEASPVSSRVSVVERSKDFFSAGFSVPCLKDGKQPHQKLIDHVLFLKGEKIAFKDDQILYPEFSLDGKACPLSDHRPRFVTLEI